MRNTSLGGSVRKWFLISNILFLCVNIALLLAQILVTQYRVVFAFEKDKSWWTQFPWSVVAAVLSSSATLFGGYVAFRSLLTNTTQQQNQFAERQETERQRFERQQLNTEFTDILNRLADSHNVLMRSNAASRLADMAMRKNPTNDVETFPDSYPFFSRAASHLASTLYIEENRSVRNEAKKALQKMVEFAQAIDATMLHILVEELADANRSAFHNLSDEVASYLCQVNDPNEDNINVSRLSDIVLIEPANKQEFDVELSFLHSITNSKSFTASYKARKAISVLNDTSHTQDSKTDSHPSIHINKVWIARVHLTETIDTLSFVINALPAPDNPPKDAESLREWNPTYSTDLTNCVLPGSDLEGAQLARASFNNAYLHGANMMGANLLSADMSNAILIRSRLSNARLQGATLNTTYLDSAKLQGANLEGASVIRASLKKTFMAGVILGMKSQDAFGFTDLTDSDWWNADQLSWSGTGGIETHNWLEQRYPQPETYTIT